MRGRFLLQTHAAIIISGIALEDQLVLYLEVALSICTWKLYYRSILLTEQDHKSIGGVCMHAYVLATHNEKLIVECKGPDVRKQLWV